MRSTFIYTLKALLRERGIIIWVILFPLVLSTLFNSMFSNLEKEAYQLNPIPCAVVDDGSQSSQPFSQMIDALSSDSGNSLLDAVHVDSVEDAQNLLQEGSVVGYIQLDSEGTPSLTVSPVVNPNSMDAVNRTVLADVVNNYIRSKATIESIAADDPGALANSSIMQSLYQTETYTRQISITHSTSAQSVRYFYALLGFSTLMAATVGLQAIIRTQPNLSPLGARRAVGGLSRTRTLAATIAASWLLAFAGLLLGFAYMRYALGIDFGGRDAACIAGIGMGSLVSTALGTCIGAIPKIRDGAKGGIITGLTCILSLFAGLYGTPSLNLADEVARNAPLLSALNPAKQVSDLFYSLYFYPDYDPFFHCMLGLAAIAAIFAVIAAILMRRQRYASL
jgi:ABC-2 type transport system permease protein